MPPAQTAYDAIPYGNTSFPQTRPDRLAAVAKLFGLDAPPVETARVLELGCAAGGNLVAMAAAYPDARFVGIDASARQIADGWAAVQAVPLKNVQLRHLDIAAAGDDLGEFDYIISHGVYSWVPPAVQDKLLELVRRHLAPTGVAYVSYNTYPGWHIRGIVRDMMRYHGTQFADPSVRLAQAKALVQFVADSGKAEDSRYKQLLRDEFGLIAGAADWYLHHDHMEEDNRPVYFHEFARQLAVNGLQYLGEAEFSTMVSTNFAPEVAATLHTIGAHDILQMEQYMDFVRCRYFRQTLICNRTVPLNRLLGPAVVKGVRLASNAAPSKPDVAFAEGEEEKFSTPNGSGLNCRHPLTKAALLVLARVWPAALPFADVYAQAKEEAAAQGHPAGDGGTEDFLAGDLLAGMAAGVVEWRVSPAPYVTTVGERPEASALARHQAREGTAVTNLRGEALTLDVIHRQLVRDLDGTRDRAALTDALVGVLKDGNHTLRRDGDDTPVTDEAEMRDLLGPALEKALANLARFALLAR